MTFENTLFGLIPQASTGQQWVARSMQLVNWGGYNGYHQVPFHPDGTLISGGSGTGKSTLLDAYIALMMPHTTPFNGASNGATTGRARSKDQRNIISYVRGKVDDQRDGDSIKDSVLRGDKSDTWSAISMTWTDQSKQLFTAVRIFYVPKGAQKNEDCTFRRAVVHGAMDLRVLEQYAVGKFAPGILSGALGMSVLETDSAFSAKLQSVLGIGAHGDGDKALQLLARIQAGQQISTVDALYKQMVLEEPETFATADKAIAHFDELSAVRSEMIRAEEQVTMLRPMLGLRETRDEALGKVALIDQLGALSGTGATGDGQVSAFGLWRDRNALDLITEQEDDNRKAYASAKAAKISAAAAVSSDDAQLEIVRDNQRKSGGDQIEALNRELRAAENTLAATQSERAKFDRVLSALDIEVGKKSEFDAMIRTGREEISAAEGAAERRREAEYEAMHVKRTLQDEAAKIKHEIGLLRTQKGNIPPELHESRLAFAQAMGVGADELPFVGELIEIRPEYESWRDAIGLALGGFATTILVDKTRLSDFRSAINSIHTPRRMQFEGVDTGLRIDEPTDRYVLPGRLDYKHTQFTGWLVERLDEQFGFVCVSDPSELGAHKKALTQTGQTSQGSRGAHGGQGQRSAIGFSNEARIRDLVAALEEKLVQITEAEAMVNSVTSASDAQQSRIEAFRRLADYEWPAIDVAGAENAVSAKNVQLNALMEGNDVLAALKKEEKEILARLEKQRRELAKAEGAMEAFNAEYEILVEKEDAAKDAIDTAENESLEISDSQALYLTELLNAVPGADWNKSLADFEHALSVVRLEIKHDYDTAATAAATAGNDLARIFDRFREAWPNPNLGGHPDDSYADFERILDDLERQKLYAIKEKWNRNVARLSGQEFTRLNAQMTQAIDLIRARMAPVNDILWELPFQDSEHRLRISAKATESMDIKNFRKQLRELATDVQGEQTLKQREARYKKIAELLGRIRPESLERRRLIDVREHVRIEALKVDLHGNEVSVFDHIAGKSGGESQELVAFIVGSALRYQLGDSDAERPRYAPVFLDEAFIKADSRFAGRAVTAWQGLGFQLIIGAPLDKVSALEPHMSLLIQTVKNADGHTHLDWTIPADASAQNVALDGAFDGVNNDALNGARSEAENAVPQDEEFDLEGAGR